jgi:hypothetical protein
MRVGFIVECGPAGADEKVLDYLVKALRTDVEPRFQTCGPTGKREILADCHKQVEKLFDKDRCDRVFVVWDLMPCDAEHRHRGRPSCEKERDHIWAKLRDQDRKRTVLLCITHELETWLLADGSALTKVIERRSHPMRPIPDERRPEKIENPKARLKEHFNSRPGGYNDLVHARKIIEQASLAKLERVPSFARFRQKLQMP